MLKFRNICIITGFVSLLAILPAWGLDLQPGQYEITAEVDMPGMPAKMPAQKMTQCLTEQDPVPSASADAQGCEVTDMSTKGNTITYTMVCEQQGMKSESNGHITFKGNAFEGTARTIMGSSAGGMTITTKIKGTRTGPCE